MEADQITGLRKNSANSRFVWVAMLLGLIAIIIALLVYNEFKHQAQISEKNQTELAKAVTQISQAMHTFEAQTQEQKNKVNDLDLSLARMAQMTNPVDQGVLVQADYLTRLAQLNLAYEGNVASALALLTMVDKRVATLSLPSILSVRQAISTSINQLEAVPVVDLTGVITKLNALSEQIEQLPLVPNLPSTPATIVLPKKPTKIDSYLTDWKDALSTSWDALQRVIIIRHHGQAIEPLLQPAQFLYLKQNIELQLQQAQWAALHRQQALYLDSLKRATTWVNHYFTDNNVASRAIQQNLVELQKIDIAPALPDLSPTIEAIQKAQKQVYSARPTVAPVQTGEGVKQ